MRRLTTLWTVGLALALTMGARADDALDVGSQIILVNGSTITVFGSFTPDADPGVDHSSYVAGHSDGANCAAGEIPLGVDAAGAVEGCYEPTEADITDLVHLATSGSPNELLTDDGAGGIVSESGMLFDGTTLGIGIAPIAGVKLLLPQENDAVTPTLAFGDGDTGIYETLDDQLMFSIGGTPKFFMFSSSFEAAGLGGAGGSILWASASATVATLVPAEGDPNTGVGHADADAGSLIAGSLEILRFSNDGTDNVVTIKGNASQAENALVVEKSDGTKMFGVNPASGFVGIGTDLPREELEILDKTDLASESLTDGDFSAFTNWSEVGDFSEGTTAYDYLHSGGTGTLTQPIGDFTIPGVGARWYKLQYTISSVTETGILAATLTTGFADTAVTLIVDTAASQTHYFLSKAAPGDFVISATSDTALDGFTIDDVTLKEVVGGDLIVNGNMGIGISPLAGTRLLLPQENDAVTPTLAFGDGDSGFFEGSDDSLWVSIAGSKNWKFSDNQFEGFASGSARLKNLTATSTNPVFSFQGDTDTGMGATVGSNQLSLIAGGVQQVNISTTTATFTGYIARSVSAGLTASDTQSQGQGPLTSEINEVATVANPDDVRTLTSAVDGYIQTVINNGGNTMQIFPASGDDLGAGLNVSVQLEMNESVTFFAYDADNWHVGAGTGVVHGFMLDEDNTDAFVINDAGSDFHSYHTNGLSLGLSVGWTFDAGGNGTSFPIVSVANSVGSPGTQILVTTTGAHGLAVGDIISQTNLADGAYVGIFEIIATAITTTYEIAAVFTATGTGTMDQAATLTCGAGFGGDYQIAWEGSATSTTNNETFDFRMYHETTSVPGSKATRKFGTAGDFGAFSGLGLVRIGDGEKLSFALSNEDSAGDITIKHFAIIATRL